MTPAETEIANSQNQKTMTKQNLIDLCAERGIDPQDAFNELAEAMRDFSHPDLHSVDAVAAWLDQTFDLELAQ